MTTREHRLDIIAKYHTKTNIGPMCRECLLPWPCRSWRAAVLEPRKEDQETWQPDKQTP